MLDIPTQQRPIDCAISPDGRYGIVRTGSWHQTISDGRIYVIDLQHTPSPAVVVDAPQPYSMFFYSSRALDFVEDYCISLGGYDPSGNAVSGFFQLGPLHLPPNQSFSLTNLPSGAGYDAASTFDLVNGKPIIGAATLGASFLQVSPLRGVFSDSVPNFTDSSGYISGVGTGLSDMFNVVADKFIVLKNYVNPSSGSGGVALNHGFVGLGRLSPIAQPPGTSNSYVFSSLTGPSVCNCVNAYCQTPQYNRAVHDVALTPNGRFAIVSGFQLYGVYDMVTLQEVFSAQRDPVTFWSASQPQLPEVGFYASPFMRVTSDSVEATNSRAVIVGGVWPAGAPCTVSAKEASTWRVAILNLRTKEDVTFQGPTPSSACDGAAASDVAVTPNGQWAIMSTRNGAYRITLGTTVWPPPAPEPYNDGTDSLDVNGSSAFVSDSVVCTNTRAVVIGRDVSTGVPQAMLIDLNQSPSSVTAATKIVFAPEFDSQNQVVRITPTDVMIDPSEKYAIVRVSQSDGVFGGNYGRIVVIDISAASVVAQFHVPFTAANPVDRFGAGFALDQLACTKDHILSIGESAQAQTSLTSFGRIQVVKLQ